MNKPLSETHPSMTSVLKLRRFSDYSDYLMGEEDSRWDDFADKEVVPTSHVQKNTTDNAVLRAAIEKILYHEEDNESGRHLIECLRCALLKELGLDQDGDA